MIELKNTNRMKSIIQSLIIVCLYAINAYSQNTNNDGGHGLGPQTATHGLGQHAGHSSMLNFGNANKALKTKDSNSDAPNPLSGKKDLIQRSIKSNVMVGNDSVFYLHVTKRNGWPEGVGKPLRKEELSHIPVYYVLSNKNSAGKWTFMRAFNAYGNLTTNHSWGTYLINQNNEFDTGANAEWVDKLNTVCQWEYLGDSEGKEVIQERALDKDKNIIFCYNIAKVSENKKDGSIIYAGSYTDAFALPVFMRTDSLGDYRGQANFVQVKRDKRGYDILFAFTDETGRIRLNKDGAYQTSRDYDKNGMQIREASLDLVGNQMIDSYGNCGWLNEVDDYGSILKATYFGKNNEPIKMPGTMGSNQVYGYEFCYDEYHRETDRWYLDSLGNHDTNEYGVYHSVSEYNDHGERISYSNYDKEGNPIGNDEYGIAQAVTEYDSIGNLLLIEWRNKDKSPINGYGDYCRRIMTYDTKGNIHTQHDYIKDDCDSIIVSFKYISDGMGNETRYWYTEGYYRTDSVDVKGRPTLEAWYKLDNSPATDPNDESQAWHKHITKYDDNLNTTIEEWLNENGYYYVNTDYDLTNKYNQSTVINDTVNHINTYSQFLYPYGLSQQYQTLLDDDGYILAQWDITPYGEKARVGWWNNLHYKCKVNYTMYGKLMNMMGVNEFDEPSYLVELNDNGNIYHYSDLGTYYDENMREIPADSMANFKDNLPKAFCIEVTDTTIAYPLGLRNNDIILSYGDWSTSEDLRSNINYFYLETILKNALPKRIKVLRHDIITKSSSIYEFDLPEGKPSELGFYPHQIYYTEKEANRLRNACNLYDFAYGSPDAKLGKQILMGVQLKGGIIQSRFYHFPMYDYKDPGLLLYASEKYSSGYDTWSVLEDDVDKWYNKNMYDSRFSGETELFLTQDFNSTKKLSKSSSGNRGLRIMPINVSDEVFNNLISYYKTVDELPNQKGTSDDKNGQSINDKQLVGKWHAEIEKDEFNLSLTFDLGKKNSASVSMLLCFGGEIYPEVIINVPSSLKNTGTWELQGNKLTLQMNEDTRQLHSESIEFTGASEAQQQEILDKYKELEPDIFKILCSFETELLSSIIIENVSKTELTTNMNDEIVKFQKIN